jgi:hypothetical protein
MQYYYHRLLMWLHDSQVTLNDGEDYAIEDGIHYSFTCTAQGKTSGDRNDCDNNRHINKHVKDESLCRVTDDISGLSLILNVAPSKSFTVQYYYHRFLM